MNKEEFNITFQKLIPQMSRYLYTVLASKGISQTRITPKDVINQAYIDIADKEITYRQRTPDELRGFILQSLKWTLHKSNYQMNRSCVLLEAKDGSALTAEQIINKTLEESEITYPDFAYIDSKQYEKIIRSYSNKIHSSYYLDYITMRDINKEKDTDLHKRLRIKYNLDVKDTNVIMSSIKSFLKSKLKQLKKTKHKAIFVRSSISYKADDLSPKQKKVKNNVRMTMALYNRKLTENQIAKELNIPRPTIHFYIQTGKKWKKLKN